MFHCGSGPWWKRSGHNIIILLLLSGIIPPPRLWNILWPPVSASPRTRSLSERPFRHTWPFSVMIHPRTFPCPWTREKATDCYGETPHRSRRNDPNDSGSAVDELYGGLNSSGRSSISLRSLLVAGSNKEISTEELEAIPRLDVNVFIVMHIRTEYGAAADSTSSGGNMLWLFESLVTRESGAPGSQENTSQLRFCSTTRVRE